MNDELFPKDDVTINSYLGSGEGTVVSTRVGISGHIYHVKITEVIESKDPSFYLEAELDFFRANLRKKE